MSIIKKLPAALVTMVLLLASGAVSANQGGTHLEPMRVSEGSAWDTSPIAKVVFREAFEADTLVRMEASYAFGGPSDGMTILKKTDGGYSIVYLHTRDLLSTYTPGAVRSFNFPLSQADYHRIRPSRCEFEISKPLGDRIVQVWRAVLRKTRDDGNPWLGADGANFEFSMRDGAHERNGRIWSPDEGTEPSVLIDVATAMQDVCKSGIRRRIDALESNVDLLSKHLAKDKQK